MLCICASFVNVQVYVWVQTNLHRCVWSCEDNLGFNFLYAIHVFMLLGLFCFLDMPVIGLEFTKKAEMVGKEPQGPHVSSSTRSRIVLGEILEADSDFKASNLWSEPFPSPLNK